ncbi:MAG: hypothetical protein IPF55_00405 [Rhodoferax sp.]|nr:hypothetical protein [Rhodoferax sp.]
MTRPRPRPPLGAQQFTTACDYCVVGCSYRVWRWPVDARGAPDPSVPFANPAQHNVVQWQGRPPCAGAARCAGEHRQPGGQPLDARRHPGAEVPQQRQPHPRTPEHALAACQRQPATRVVGHRHAGDGDGLQARAGPAWRTCLGHQGLFVPVFREHLRDYQTGV